jgi:hypothetical protein
MRLLREEDILEAFGGVHYDCRNKYIWRLTYIWVKAKNKKGKNQFYKLLDNEERIASHDTFTLYGSRHDETKDGYLDIIERESRYVSTPYEFKGKLIKLAVIDRLTYKMRYSRNCIGGFCGVTEDFRHWPDMLKRGGHTGEISVNKYNDAKLCYNRLRKRSKAPITLKLGGKRGMNKPPLSCRGIEGYRKIRFDTILLETYEPYNNLRKYPSDKNLAEYYNRYEWRLRNRTFKKSAISRKEYLAIGRYFERAGIDPKTLVSSDKYTLKSIARHIAKKSRRLKQIAVREIEIFKMMHGASLLKNLKDRRITIQ